MDATVYRVIGETTMRISVFHEREAVVVRRAYMETFDAEGLFETEEGRRQIVNYVMRRIYYSSDQMFVVACDGMEIVIPPESS